MVFGHLGLWASFRSIGTLIIFLCIYSNELKVVIEVVFVALCSEYGQDIKYKSEGYSSVDVRIGMI